MTWNIGFRRSQGRANKPKPDRLGASLPTDPASPGAVAWLVAQIMYDLARLAFETDSTRTITLMLNSVGIVGRPNSRRNNHR